MENMALTYFPRQNKLSLSERTFLSDFNLINKNKIANQKLEAFAIFTLIKMQIGDCSESGFFLKADEKHLALLASEMLFGIDLKFLKRVLQSCFNNGLFDKVYYDKFNILTSYDIQSEYFFSKKVKERAIPSLPKLKDLIYESIWVNLKNSGKNEESRTTNSNNRSKNGETKPNQTETNTDTDIKKKNLADTPLASNGFSLSDLKNLFPDKGCKVEVVPANLDLKLLSEKISESEFLKSAKNLSIDWCIKNYNQIISDTYKNYGSQQQKHAEQNLKSRDYSNQNLNNLLDDLDKIELEEQCDG